MMLEELSVVFSADIAPFTQAVSQISAMLPGVANAADGLADAFQAAGAQAALGLENGLLSRRGTVAAAARLVADAAADALRKALQIHSPSKITYETGVFFDEGLLRGIQDSAERVDREASALGVSAAQALQIPEMEMPLSPQPVFGQAAAAPAEKEMPISIQIPLEIDGYRLGLAAIEGINRVTQGTGRLDLKL